LIVVAIIGILAAIAVPNFMNAQIRAKIARVESDLKTLATAISMYRLDHNQPPHDMWSDHGWARSYALLTSPTAYMNSILPDVFQAKDVQDQLKEGHRVSGPNSPLTYDYGTAAYHGYTGDSKHAWYRAWRNSSWKIGSPGPDLSYLNITPISGWISAYPYDASNGLISIGDIFRGEEFYSKDAKQRGL
jgi:type II secretory pathway pseudopilin PulG